MIESTILFLNEYITWEYCENNLTINENNLISINLLKEALKSKKETRKRVNFVSLTNKNR